MQAPLQARNDADAAQTDTARTVAQKRVLADNRPEAVAERKLAEMMNNSPRVLQQRVLSDAIHNSPRMVAQRHEMNAFFGGAVKPQGDGAMPAEASLAQREEKTNRTGLPNQLKSGIESLSGMSMDHVTVHYNSDKPAQLQAHAYAQGSEIHLGAGQERHLPHEAWHVVQQAQDRVRPTLQMKAGAVNDDPSLEKEADMMGEKAAREGTVQMASRVGHGDLALHSSESVGIVQRVVYANGNAMWQAVAPTFNLASIMAVINGNPELANHYQAVIAHLNIMDFVQVGGAQPNASYAQVGGTYNINYDTPANQQGRFSQEEFFVGAIIHEMGHVASSQLYDTQIPDGTDYHIANMHLPALNGAPFPGELFGPNQLNDLPSGLIAQEATMTVNWDILENLMSGSSDFSAEEQLLLQSRMDYARGASSHAHYDTVLADILFYLQHRQMHLTRFYLQATAMLHEANLRRAAGAGAVANVALVPALAQDTATLHAAVNQLLNDPRWSAKGEALIGHKTPDGIKRMRAVFASHPNMREALEDVRATAAVIAATQSKRRIAVTQLAYQTLSTDDRAAGLAQTIAAVNGVIAQL